MHKPDFSSINRLVVKIGTRSLTGENSKLNEKKVARFVENVMKVRRGREVLIVTSGAIGAGLGKLGLEDRPSEIGKLQAMAAVGQGLLMQVYEKYFAKHGQTVAQLLLTKEDFTDPRRLQNLKTTLHHLLHWGTIPLINENDTVATEEIKIGDNDLLAAYVAIHLKADLLVLLSDVDGLYTEDPKNHPEAEILRVVDKIPPGLLRRLKKLSGGFGGMYTKVLAAKMAGDHGIPTVLANSEERDVLRRILRGESIGTLFLPHR